MNRKSTRRISLMVLCALLLLSAAAWAIDIQTAPPALEPTGLFTLYTSDPLKMGQFSLGLVGDYAYAPMVLADLPQNGDEMRVVDQMIAGNFYAAVGLFDRVDVMAGVSFNYVSGFDMDNFGRYFSDLNATTESAASGLGDTKLGIKIMILQNKPGSVGLALLPFGSFPTGLSDSYMASGAIDAGMKVVLDKRISRLNLVANLGYQYMGVAGDITPDGEILAGLGVVYRPHKVVDILAEINFRTQDYHLHGVVDQVGGPLAMDVKAGFPTEVLAGVKLYTNAGVSFDIGLGAGLPTGGLGNPMARGILGLAFTYPRIPRTLAKPDVKVVERVVEKEVVPEPLAAEPAGPEPIIAKSYSGIIMYESHVEFPQPIAFVGQSGDKLTDQSEQYLDEVAQMLVEHPSVMLQIEGHVAAGGEAGGLAALTQVRANTVRSYLVDKGVDGKRLTAVGYGASVPIASNATPEGRAKNTRIDMIVMEK